MRHGSDRVADAVAEFLDIGRRSGARVHVSHHNVVGRRNRGRLTGTVAGIHAAREGGVDVTVDFLHFYPYYHPHRLDELLPPEQSGVPLEVLRDRLSHPSTRERIRAAFAGGWISNLELTYPGAAWDYNVLEAPGLALPEHPASPNWPRPTAPHPSNTPPCPGAFSGAISFSAICRICQPCWAPW